MFNKIILVDKTGLEEWAISELQNFSIEKIDIYTDCPETEAELVKRIGSAECVFVSWYTKITKNVMKECPNIKYIGMCCSLYDESSANVDIVYARRHGIVVNGVRDYGDEGVIEFIFSELIRLVKGLGSHQWKDEPVELTNRKLGVIGMGTTGAMLSQAAKIFRMDVYYYDRNRRLDAEAGGAKFLPLEELLSSCEIISTHLPKNTVLLDNNLFSVIGEGKILVNTSLGLTFKKKGFLEWVRNDGNYAIFDECGVAGNEDVFKEYHKIITTNKVAGWTTEAIERLSVKVLGNLKEYIGEESRLYN